ncbi:uncharacterized protein TrAtP1_005627 [Trichoderma atroviride]|uniref:uncharacterized protein n=1 Tax=Hypocrea atroviridis TaxID=63577 RepID=UPI003327CC43|nr:hypothetical protein TrAtP1_005627 [Trichoderma atroviride]
MELPLPEALITYGHVLDGANRSLSDLNEFRLQGMQSERIGFGATALLLSNWLCCTAEGHFCLCCRKRSVTYSAEDPSDATFSIYQQPQYKMPLGLFACEPRLARPWMQLQRIDISERREFLGLEGPQSPRIGAVAVLPTNETSHPASPYSLDESRHHGMKCLQPAREIAIGTPPGACGVF